MCVNGFVVSFKEMGVFFWKRNYTWNDRFAPEAFCWGFQDGFFFLLFLYYLCWLCYSTAFKKNFGPCLFSLLPEGFQPIKAQHIFIFFKCHFEKLKGHLAISGWYTLSLAGNSFANVRSSLWCESVLDYMIQHVGILLISLIIFVLRVSCMLKVFGFVSQCWPWS